MNLISLANVLRLQNRAMHAMSVTKILRHLHLVRMPVRPTDMVEVVAVATAVEVEERN
jgi:hypothetical protein